MPDLQPPDLTGPPVPRPLPGSLDPDRVLAEHARSMFRSARRVSMCDDDAHDAVQAAAERFLKHRDRVDPETVGGWLATVARNEALRVRERRSRTGGIDDDDRRLVHTGDGPEELAAREEEVALAREALGRLKPQERLALWMQAEGRSYDEIAEELSWTRTKVNRSITEGRASLRRTLSGIATGESCAAAGPRIDRLAAGSASADDLGALRPHLRRCASCRARLRRARGGRWGVLPPLLVAWTPWAGRATTSGSARPRIADLVADRVAMVLPAASGAATEVGIAVTTGLAVVALGVGVAAGGAEDDDTEQDRGRRVGVALRAPAPASVAPVGTVRRALVSSVPAVVAADRAVADRRARAAARRERLRRRAAKRAAERRARAAARRRADAARAAAAASAAAAPSGASRTTGSTGATTGTGGGSGASSGGGAAPSSGGSTPGAADEFGFE